MDTGGGRRIAVSQHPVDDVESTLPLVQSQLEVGCAAPRVVLVAPLDVEDPVRSGPTGGGKDPISTIHRVQVPPVRHDGIVVCSPGHTHIAKGDIRSGELGIAVG